MSRFIESICILDGVIQNPQGHLERVGRTLLATTGNFHEKLFSSWFDVTVPRLSGKYKWRIVYDQRGIVQSTVTPYQSRAITSLKIVHADNLDYAFKYLDRSGIDALMSIKGPASDILIMKNGYLTDSSYANVVLWDGSTWWTPDTPLLPGTQRAALLKEGLIGERPIHAGSLRAYKKIRLINAMLSFNEAPEIEIGPKTII